ncbi:MAG TPA: hypothetical protein VM659_15970 [Dongiaceae bacterium]|nr:hypothetical protein [Dongiaceae bacterium]
MRSHLEFVSEAFPPVPGEDKAVNPGLFGQNLALFLAEQLPQHGYTVERVHPEDWGWRIALAHEPCPLWIGCGHQDGPDDNFLCFIEPSKPVIRRWLKKIDTTEVTERLAQTLQTILEQSGKVRELHWWGETAAQP